jgi:hypothetical protein
LKVAQATPWLIDLANHARRDGTGAFPPVASAAVRRVEQDMLANLDASEQDQMRRRLTACIASLSEQPASAT